METCLGLAEVQDSASGPGWFLDLASGHCLHDLELLEPDLALDWGLDELEVEQQLLPLLPVQEWSQEFCQFSDPPRTCTEPGLQPLEAEFQEQEWKHPVPIH